MHKSCLPSLINLKDIYNNLGEERTKEILSDYKCELNKDVEYFLKERAIEFSKQDYSRTYIVMSQYKDKDVIVGYFAITNKITNIKKVKLSETKRKKLLKFAIFDKESKSYNIVWLLSQPFFIIPYIFIFNNGHICTFQYSKLLKLNFSALTYHIYQV